MAVLLLKQLRAAVAPAVPLLRVRWMPLLPAGAGIQLLLGITSTPPLLLVVSMGLIAGFLWGNRAHPGFPLAFAGVVLNLAVIAVNGAMPVSPRAAAFVGDAGIGGADLRHSVADGDTLLPFLGDVIPLGTRVVSVGDLFIFAGLGWFLWRAMLSLLRRTDQAAAR